MNLVVLYFQFRQKFRLKMNPDFYFRPASFIFLIITQYSPKHFLLVLKILMKGHITLVMAMASILFLSVLAIAVLLVVLVMLVMLLVI